MEKGHQEIKCRVETCKFHDSTDCCTLSDIVVGADTCECKKTSETKCMSFECGC